ALAVVSVNKNGVIDVQDWVVGEVGDEKFPARERFLEFPVRFFLISPAVQKKHSRISRPEICDPAQSDVSLHQPSLRLAHFPQIAIAGENDPLFRRQWIVPWRFARHRANALMHLAFVQSRRIRIEPRELVKLLNGPRHDETAARIAVRFFPFKEIVVGNDFSLFVGEHGCIREGESVAVIIETCGRAGFRSGGSKKNYCKTCARSIRQWTDWLRRTIPSSHPQL